MITNEGNVKFDDISENGITDGLVAYYPLNGDTLDYSGNGNHGTNNGAIVVDGLKGKSAYDFDGTTSLVDIESDSIHSLSEGSISMWFNLPIGKDFARIFSGYNQDGNNHTSIVFGNTYTPSPYADMSLSFIVVSEESFVAFRHAAVVREGNTKYFDGKWHHLYIEVQGSVCKIYVDGINKNAITPEAEAGHFLNSTPDNHYQLFGFHYDATPRYYEGTVQDLRIYDRALTEAEIKINYNLFSPTVNAGMQVNNNTLYVHNFTEGSLKPLLLPQPNNLILNLPLNGDALDISGQGNDFIASEGLSFVAGRGGQKCAQIDAALDSILKTDAGVSPFDLEYDDQFTIASWVNVSDSDSYFYIFGKNYLSGTYGGYELDIDTTGSNKRIRFGVGSSFISVNTYGQLFYSFPQAYGEWFHIVAIKRGLTYAPTNLELYVNGSKVAASTGGNGNSQSTMLNNEPVTIGRRSGTPYSGNGLTQNTLCWNTDLSEAEVAELFASY